MKFPFVVKDRSTQANFDFLTTHLGFSKIGPVRQNTVSMAAGVTAFPVITTGFTKVQGIIVVEVNPAAHWAFTWYMRPTLPDIVFSNSGAVQNVTYSYMIVGS